MIKKILIAILLLQGVATAAPLVSDTTFSESTVNGDSVTITLTGGGSHADNDFGTNDYICAAWDDFEDNVAIDTYLTSADTLLATTDQRTNSTYSVAIDNTTTSSDDASDCVYLVDLVSTSAWYTYFVNTWASDTVFGSSNVQYKMYRQYNGISGAEDLYPNMSIVKLGASDAQVDIELISGDAQSLTGSNNLTDGGNHVVEIFLQKSSGIGETDGIRKIWYDGVLVINETLRTDNDGHNNYNKLWTVHDYKRNSDGMVYYDNVFLDYTQARVMILNEEGLPEIQIPTAWSDASITINYNEGSITTLEGRTLRVYDSDGSYDDHVIDFGLPPSALPPTKSRISGNGRFYAS